jgi:hypothetical protein
MNFRCFGLGCVGTGQIGFLDTGCFGVRPDDGIAQMCNNLNHYEGTHTNNKKDKIFFTCNKINIDLPIKLIHHIYENEEK